MLDGAQLAEYLNGAVVLGTEVLRVFGRGGFTFVLAGLRRQILEAAHDAECNFELLDLLRLKRLGAKEASQLVEHVAQRATGLPVGGRGRLRARAQRQPHQHQ